MTLAGAPAQRLVLGDATYVAVPAERARATAYLLLQGAARLRERDGLSGLDWLDQLLEQLRAVDSEHRSAPAARSRGSADRTADPVHDVDGASWAHDTVTIAEAVALTGWSAGYLARLARAGLGCKRAGVWHLDRDRLLARQHAEH